MTARAKLLTKIAASYDDMFKPLLGIAPQLAGQVKPEIQWAKSTLKKQDRITWFLRWVRLRLALNAKNAGGENSEALINLYNKYMNEAVSKSGVNQDQIIEDVMAMRRIKENLTHFYSMGIPEIDNLVLKYETPTALDEKFEELEAAAHAAVGDKDNLIEPEDDDEIFMQLGDGWAWWILHRAACTEESRAMGHCGNSPNRNRDDQEILSLRKEKKVGHKSYWEPHLTFILEDGHELGEMKGKNNDKPTERYHNAIVALLSNKRITSIKGGGYLPEHNFRFGDLSQKDQEKVMAANPNLSISPFEEYHRTGKLTPALIKAIEDQLSVTYEKGHGFVIQEWDTTLDMLSDLGDRDVSAMARDVDIDPANMGEIIEYAFADVEDDDPILRNIVQSLYNDFPTLQSRLTDFDPNKVEQVRNLVVELADRFPDAQSIKAIFSATQVDEEVLEEVYQKWSDNYGAYAYLYKSRDNNKWYWTLDDTEEAVRMTEEGYNLDHIDQPSLKMKEGLFGASLQDAFKTPIARGDREDQPRLFKKPESDEEAKRDGIHISYLLQPKEAVAVSDFGQAYMQLSGDKIVEEATIGDYEVFVLKSGVVPNTYLLGMQRVGNDAFNPMEQMEKKPASRGTGSMAELKQTIDGWLQKYGQLVIGSHNPEKTQQYERLAKRLGYTVKSREVMGLALPYIEKAGEAKTAYVSPSSGEITLSIDLGARPTVMISIDLGIPNFTVFTITVPVENLSNTEIDVFVRQAFEALIQNVTAFLVTMKYPEDLIAEVLSSAESSFMELGGEDASDAGMPDQDRGLRLYESDFTLPEEFIYQTRDKVVTASTVRRTPEVREIVLTPLDSVTPTGTPAATIEFYLDQATRHTPRAFSVQVVDTADAEKRRGPKARDWESRLLQPVA